MATYAIDPSDDLYAELDMTLPSDAKRSPGKAGISLGTIAIGLAVAGGMAGLAELWTGAVSDMFASARSKGSQIQMGRVDDMPEIKNGVVALGTVPVRVIPGAPVAPTPTNMAAAPQSPAAPRPSEMKTASIAPAAPAAVASVIAAPAARPVAAPRVAAEKGPVATGSTNAATPVAAATPARALASVATPLPPARAPARPAANVLASVVTQPPVVAPPSLSPRAPLPPTRTVQRKVDAPAQRVASAQPAGAAAAAQADAQERSLLGIPVPGFVPSGNDIKSGFDSIGDAVMGLPKRF